MPAIIPLLVVVLPADSPKITAIEYAAMPQAFGGLTKLRISARGRIWFQYQSAPHTGSGGRVITKKWKIPEKEAGRIIAALTNAGITKLKRSKKLMFPWHEFSIQRGNKTTIGSTQKLPERAHKLLHPLLKKGNPLAAHKIEGLPPE